MNNYDIICVDHQFSDYNFSTRRYKVGTVQGESENKALYAWLKKHGKRRIEHTDYGSYTVKTTYEAVIRKDA